MHKDDEVRYPAGFPGSARPILDKALAENRAERHAAVSDFQHDVHLMARPG